jgi:hypothetical protein
MNNNIHNNNNNNSNNSKSKKKETSLEIKKIQKVLDYFVAEGIAYEVEPGFYALTEGGKKMSK